MCPMREAYLDNDCNNGDQRKQIDEFIFLFNITLLASLTLDIAAAFYKKEQVICSQKKNEEEQVVY